MLKPQSWKKKRKECKDINSDELDLELLNIYTTKDYLHIQCKSYSKGFYGNVN